jgi:hypothetical protein
MFKVDLSCCHHWIPVLLRHELEVQRVSTFPHSTETLQLLFQTAESGQNLNLAWKTPFCCHSLCAWVCRPLASSKGEQQWAHRREADGHTAPFVFSYLFIYLFLWYWA